MAVTFLTLASTAHNWSTGPKSYWAAAHSKEGPNCIVDDPIARHAGSSTNWIEVCLLSEMKLLSVLVVVAIVVFNVASAWFIFAVWHA